MRTDRVFTVVSFHAHPDDEALLTGGTLARAAADGHRVVLVTATDGAAGLTSPELTAGLAERRRRELAQAARALGCARMELFGYPDSGSAPGPTASGTFAALDPDQVARRLARLLIDEGADVLTSYDAAGGYGHPDHVQVHQVAARAAALARTPVVLEATVDRRLLRPAARLAGRLSSMRAMAAPAVGPSAFSAANAITHRVDVRGMLDAKRAALRAHRSQAESGGGTRTIALLLRLPGPLFSLALGREWFIEPGRQRPGRPIDDIFASLRARQEG